MRSVGALLSITATAYLDVRPNNSRTKTDFFSTLCKFEERSKTDAPWMHANEYTNLEIAQLWNASGAIPSPSTERVLMKRTSDQLARLYRMGFLSRRRVRRICSTARGRRCYRGFMYLYRINKQGQDYLTYRKNEPPLQISADLSLGPTGIPTGAQLKGRYRRFPPRLYPWTATVLDNIKKEFASKDSQIAQLRVELRQSESDLAEANEMILRLLDRLARKK